MKQCYDKCDNHNEETTTISDLDQEVAIFREEIRAATEGVRNLAGNIAKICEITKETQAQQNGHDREDKTEKRKKRSSTTAQMLIT